MMVWCLSRVIHWARLRRDVIRKYLKLVLKLPNIESFLLSTSEPVCVSSLPTLSFTLILYLGSTCP
jgi:hypothetical protein